MEHPLQSHRPISVSDQRIEALTRRETQILGWLLAGHTTREIASGLHRSVHTVDNHIRSILRKLGASRRSHTVAIAMELGLARMPQPSERAYPIAASCEIRAPFTVDGDHRQFFGIARATLYDDEPGTLP